MTQPEDTPEALNMAAQVARISREAQRSCGLYFEIYQYRAVRELRALLSGLGPANAALLTQIAGREGFALDDEAFEACRDAHCAVIAQVRQEQE
jgi:hypothetical protein